MVSDLKISTSKGSETVVNAGNCYFADLYKAKLGLVFTENGKVDYSNYGNPTAVNYSIKDNLLFFYNGEGSEPVEFTFSINGNTLTLTKVNSSGFETYTFTK